jgi:hypothetical protein
MIETRAVMKLRQWLGIVLVSLLAHSMNAETTEVPTGIEGTVTVSPIHGGPSRVGVADSGPMANTVFEVGKDGGIVTTFTTDEAGKFRVPLPPGRYSIKKQDAKKFPRCGPFDVEVTASGFSKVTWGCDTGMR